MLSVQSLSPTPAALAVNLHPERSRYFCSANNSIALENNRRNFRCRPFLKSSNILITRISAANATR